MAERLMGRRKLLRSIILACIVCLLLTGCSMAKSVSVDQHNLSSQPTGQGFILEVKSNKVLVIDRKIEGKTWMDIFKKYKGNAIWLTTERMDLRPGFKIQYWIKGGIDDSY